MAARGSILLALSLALVACDNERLQVLTPPAGSAEGASSACGFPTVAACTAPLEAECREPRECCSGACVKGADEKKRCTRPPTVVCASYCERCEMSADCCSGRCEPDELGALTCMSGDCLAQGEICAGDVDCCQQAGPARCVEDPKGLRSKRCRLESSGPPCTADGSRCSAADECCGGYCIYGGRRDPVCASSCVDDGQRCTVAADCCSASAECVVVGTESLCTSQVQ